MVDVLFIPAEHKADLKLTDELIKLCSQQTKNKNNAIALYASVQFIPKLKQAIKQLKENGINVISSKPERASSKYQILGCDAFYENLKLDNEFDAFLYIGDGDFHPNALALAQKENNLFKPIIKFNPITKKSEIIKNYDFRKYRSSIMKFLSSEIIGVFISIKPGQNQFKKAKELKSKYPNKNFYYFAADNFNPHMIDNFFFIECWINSACPRIAFDDMAKMINLNDAFYAEELLSNNNLLTKD